VFLSVTFPEGTSIVRYYKGLLKQSKERALNNVTGRQLHIRYTSQEKRIILSNCTNSYINKDLKLEKEEEGKGRGKVSYIYIALVK
jgi:hypothetical protein